MDNLNYDICINYTNIITNVNLNNTFKQYNINMFPNNKRKVLNKNNNYIIKFIDYKYNNNLNEITNYFDHYDYNYNY